MDIIDPEHIVPTCLGAACLLRGDMHVQRIVYFRSGIGMPSVATFMESGSSSNAFRTINVLDVKAATMLGSWSCVHTWKEAKVTFKYLDIGLDRIYMSRSTIFEMVLLRWVRGFEGTTMAR